jgi:hypothetical protein
MHEMKLLLFGENRRMGLEMFQKTAHEQKYHRLLVVLCKNWPMIVILTEKTHFSEGCEETGWFISRLLLFLLRLLHSFKTLFHVVKTHLLYLSLR